MYMKSQIIFLHKKPIYL